MGKIASENADSIILLTTILEVKTLKKFVNDILAGIKVENDVQVILDRKNAIKSAVQTLGEDEVLLIAGKGHEDDSNYWIRKTLQFSDYEVAINAVI